MFFHQSDDEINGREKNENNKKPIFVTLLYMKSFII